MKLRVDPRLEALLVLLREVLLSSSVLAAAAFALLIRGPAMALLKLFLTTGAESSLDFYLLDTRAFYLPNLLYIFFLAVA